MKLNRKLFTSVFLLLVTFPLFSQNALYPPDLIIRDEIVVDEKLEFPFETNCEIPSSAFTTGYKRKMSPLRIYADIGANRFQWEVPSVFGMISEHTRMSRVSVAEDTATHLLPKSEYV